MDWILLISLLITGLALIVVEILFVPGTTLVGLIGFAFAVTAIFGSYEYFGPKVGHYFLSASLITFILVVYFALRTDIWLRFANKQAIHTKVNEGMLEALEVGMQGKTLSALRPIGKAEFSNRVVEVTSSGHVEEGKEVKIVQVKESRIFVEPLNT
jgi:membrane-bound ClpP family serine protease